MHFKRTVGDDNIPINGRQIYFAYITAFPLIIPEKYPEYMKIFWGHKSISRGFLWS